jgi:hypothetical protein
MGGIRQTEMHTAEPLVPQHSVSEVEVAIGKHKMYKSPSVDQIPAELIQAGEETLHLDIHKLIKLIWNKEEFPHQWKESVVLPVHKMGVVIIEAYHCCQLHTEFYPKFFPLS